MAPRGKRSTRDPATLSILALAVLLGGSLFAVGLAGHEQLSHDDAITYLAVTGHQDDYQRILDEQRYPGYEWAPARDWQTLWTVDHRFIYGEIARGLSRYDIHPPVYFWLLHTWALAFGVHIWTAPTLNAVIQLATGMLLFRLARSAAWSSRHAAIAVLLFAASPVMTQTALTARPYALVALAAVWLADVTIRYADRGDAVRAAWVVELAAVTAIGLATQLQFGAIVVASALWLVIRLAPGKRGRLWLGLAALAFGGAVFVALQPNLVGMVEQQRFQAEPFSAAELSTRLGIVTDIPAKLVFADPWPPARPVLAGVAVGLGVLAVIVSRRRLRQGVGDGRAAGLCWFALWIPIVALIGPYLAAISPRHALVEPRYLGVALPFVATWPLMAWPGLQPVKRFCIVAAVMTLTVAMVVNVRWLKDEQPEVPAWIGGTTDCIVIDQIARGVLPRIVWHLPSDAQVFAADPEFLTMNPDVVANSAPPGCP